VCIHSFLAQTAVADDAITVGNLNAKQCAAYLCPEYAPSFAKYLSAGCMDAFVPTTQLMEEAAVGAADDADVVGIPTSSLVAVAGSCGLVALIVGFVSGFREEDVNEYKPLSPI
jgi:hypothetical protein